MKIAVFWHHVREAAKERGMSRREALEWVKSLGIDAVELDGDELPDPGDFAKDLAAAEVGVSSIYMMYYWGQDPENQKDYRQITLAEEFGASRIMPVPGFYSTLDPDTKVTELERMIRGMADLVQHASAKGITVTMEDYDNAMSPIRNMEGMKSFTMAIPDLTVTLDTGNFRFSAQSCRKAYDLFRGKISHVHLKDRLLLPADTPEDRTAHGEPLKAFDGVYMYPCAVGSGNMPITEILTLLARDHYDGFVSIEHFGAADYARCIEDSAEYVLEHI